MGIWGFDCGWHCIETFRRLFYKVALAFPIIEDICLLPIMRKPLREDESQASENSVCAHVKDFSRSVRAICRLAAHDYTIGQLNLSVVAKQ